MPYADRRRIDSLTMAERQVFLVPGFFGFTSVGALSYFEDVERALSLGLQRPLRRAVVGAADPGRGAPIGHILVPGHVLCAQPRPAAGSERGYRSQNKLPSRLPAR